MKKIVFNSITEVSVNDINNRNFVGVLWNDGDKSIVIKYKEEGYKYLHNRENSIEASSNASTISELIRNSREKDGFFKEAIIFDTYKELLKWFSN